MKWIGNLKWTGWFSKYGDPETWVSLSIIFWNTVFSQAAHEQLRQNAPLEVVEMFELEQRRARVEYINYLDRQVSSTEFRLFAWNSGTFSYLLSFQLFLVVSSLPAWLPAFSGTNCRLRLRQKAQNFLIRRGRPCHFSENMLDTHSLRYCT